MNVDEAMAYASKDKCFWAGEVHTALETLTKEVERLQAVNQIFEAANVRLATELERVQAELAAAKAASVVPVEIEEVRLPTISQKPYDTVIATKTFGDMCRFRNWLRDRMKDTAPPTT